MILIKGAGKAFCAGIDVGDFFGKSAMEYKKWIASMETPLITISRLNKPVIAQVHGVAAANGAGLVAACDLAIAADNARMGLTAINVGLNCVGPVDSGFPLRGPQAGHGTTALRRTDQGTGRSGYWA